MTYSIVARDPATGELGVAVQSHWFSVGSVVPWAEPGVGAVATQSMADPSYGPNALDLMRGGAAAPAALDDLTRRDDGQAMRQVTVVDSRGQVAVHTGRRCIQFAGHETGRGFGCAANMMRREGVPQAMARAYGTAAGDLSDRLLAALDAAEAAGGDVRGRQSAAVIVVRARDEQWNRSLDLRVEDSESPLAELRRLVRLRQAYDLAERADDLTAAGRREEAALLYRRSMDLAPDNAELRFWGGLALVQLNERLAGLEAVQSAIDANAGLGELLNRLSPEIAPSAPAVRETLGRGDG
ncbi:MAG TPA: DUF1028 domain-containing protein [Thermoleophilaceae bacterium]|nr:DUF1028 domain-containing protein [Thermoleophilaceae bacterium]